MIDISKKITNELPVIKISENLIGFCKQQKKQCAYSSSNDSGIGKR